MGYTRIQDQWNKVFADPTRKHPKNARRTIKSELWIHSPWEVNTLNTGSWSSNDHFRIFIKTELVRKLKFILQRLTDCEELYLGGFNSSSSIIQVIFAGGLEPKVWQGISYFLSAERGLLLLSISTARGRTETKEYFELINFNIKLRLHHVYYGKRIARAPLFSLNRNAITNRFYTPFIYSATNLYLPRKSVQIIKIGLNTMLYWFFFCNYFYT